MQSARRSRAATGATAQARVPSWSLDAGYARVPGRVSSDPTSVAPAGIRRGSTYFPELESLRGLAILLVFVFHADGVLLAPFRSHVGAQSPLPLAFVWAGHSGVTLFFVLSAFLLSLPFLDEANGGRPVSRPHFYERRALRILPLYVAVVVVGTILTSRTLADLWRGLPYLAFLQS